MIRREVTQKNGKTTTKSAKIQRCVMRFQRTKSSANDLSDSSPPSASRGRDTSALSRSDAPPPRPSRSPSTRTSSPSTPRSARSTTPPSVPPRRPGGEFTRPCSPRLHAVRLDVWLTRDPGLLKRPGSFWLYKSARGCSVGSVVTFMRMYTFTQHVGRLRGVSDFVGSVFSFSSCRRRNPGWPSACSQQ